MELDRLTPEQLEQLRAIVASAQEEATVVDRILADLFNYLVLGVGIATLAIIVLTLLFMKWPWMRRLVFPGRTVVDLGTQHYRNMREMQLAGTWDPTENDKLLMAGYYLGACLRGAIVFLAITILLGNLATAGL